MTHRGVALNDDRNHGVLELLRPQRLTAEMVAAGLIRAYRGRPPADLAAQVARIMSHPSGADTPASQPLSATADPLNRLGTHPDLIERLWTLNKALPADCRWVVFGFPALVTPLSGVIFGFAQGTLGYALRLTGEGRAEAARLSTKPRRSGLDLGKVGSEWSLGTWHERETDWCQAAYDALS